MINLIFVFLSIVVFSPLGSLTTEPVCGKTNNGISATGRIVGGYDVGYYKYPWFAALTVNNDVSCGGTLIGSKTVLTAAHCFKPYFKNVIEGQMKLEDIYNIKVGVYNNCQNESTQRNFRSTKIEIHEKYYEEMPYFDIALITLDGEAHEYTPVCLPETIKQSETRGKEGTVQGFGRLTYENETGPCTLQEARLLIYPDEKCREIINSTENNGSALQHAFCAGYLEGKIDTCMGDSGGPFLVMGKDGRYTQLGLTSFGFGCAQKDVLGIYTDVSHFTEWIYEKLGTGRNKTTNTTEVTNPTRATNTTQVTTTSADDIKFLKELLQTNEYPIEFLYYPSRLRRRRKRPWRRWPSKYHYYNNKLNSSKYHRRSTHKSLKNARNVH